MTISQILGIVGVLLACPYIVFKEGFGHAAAQISKIAAGVGHLLAFQAFMVGLAEGNDFAHVYLFMQTLIGMASSHHFSRQIALTGVMVGIASKILFVPDFDSYHHFFVPHGAGKPTLFGELFNLFALIVGFSEVGELIAKSKLPDKAPQWLPSGFKGALLLLGLIWIASAAVDNIAAAVIGANIAAAVFRRRVHPSYIVAIVFASNAGGAWSVIGDTTTTMAWLAGYTPAQLLPIFPAALISALIVSWYGAKKQNQFQPILVDPVGDVQINWRMLGLTGAILAAVVFCNAYLQIFPAYGLWGVFIVGSLVLGIQPHMKSIGEGAFTAAFLVSLVTFASILPIDELRAAMVPEHMEKVTLALGFLSAGLDNIPLTALALKVGGFSIVFLCYAVGEGGSMMWFGSSAGATVCGKSEFKHVGDFMTWLKNGWITIPAFLVGFGYLHVFVGWEVHEPVHAAENPATHEQERKH